MIVTFCGHSDYRPSSSDEDKILSILEENAADMGGTLKDSFYNMLPTDRKRQRVFSCSLSFSLQTVFVDSNAFI